MNIFTLYGIIGVVPVLLLEKTEFKAVFLILQLACVITGIIIDKRK